MISEQMIRMSQFFFIESKTYSTASVAQTIPERIMSIFFITQSKTYSGTSVVEPVLQQMKLKV